MRFQENIALLEAPCSFN